MKIAIAAEKNNVKSNVDAHFGRCKWYCIFNTQTHDIEFIENHTNQNIKYAGHEAANLLLAAGINMVIAGRFGSKVVQIFRAKNIQMIIPEEKKIIDNIIHQIK